MTVGKTYKFLIDGVPTITTEEWEQIKETAKVHVEGKQYPEIVDLDIPKWTKHHMDLVDEALRWRLQLSDEQRTKYFLGEWIDESTAILTTSVDSYIKCDGKFVPIPDTIETSEDFINWVRSEDDRQT